MVSFSPTWYPFDRRLVDYVSTEIHRTLLPTQNYGPKMRFYKTREDLYNFVEGQKTMSEFHEQNNKSVVKRFYDEVLNNGDFSLVTTMVRDDFIDNSPAPGQEGGLDGLLKRVTTLRSAIPDLNFHVEELLADGDRVVAKWTFTGTLRTPFMGMEPTKDGLVIRGLDYIRMTDGKVRERWQFVNQTEVLKRLGVLKKEVDIIL